MVANIALPIKGWANRFAFAFLVMTAFALMLLSKAETALVEQARTAVIDAVAPALELFSQPARVAGNVTQEFETLIVLRAENVRLRQNIERLRAWQNMAHRLTVENAALRGQLNFVPDAEPRFVTVRVLADTGGAFVRSVLVGAGRANGVRRNQAAINGQGLIGRVADVGERSARILLLTDLNSRIPVLIESTGDRGILVGDNGPRPRLQYLPPNSPISPGDLVLTSGHGGVFPMGLPVGIVAEVSDGRFSVQPLADMVRLDYLRVLDYGVEGILPAPEAELLSGAVR